MSDVEVQELERRWRQLGTDEAAADLARKLYRVGREAEAVGVIVRPWLNGLDRVSVLRVAAFSFNRVGCPDWQRQAHTVVAGLRNHMTLSDLAGKVRFGYAVRVAVVVAREIAAPFWGKRPLDALGVLGDGKLVKAALGIDRLPAGATVKLRQMVQRRRACPWPHERT